MAIDKEVYSINEWRFSYKPETTVGTANTTTMQLLNVDGDVTVSHEVVQTLEPRSGQGRTLKEVDVFTTDQGGQLRTITMPIVMDTTVDGPLHENCMGTAVSTSPASVDIPYNYAPAALGNGDVVSDNISTFTVAIVSPEASESIIFPGCVLSTFAVTMDAATDGGRRHGTLTFTSRYRPANGASAPTSMAAYGSTFRYLRELTTTKAIGGDDVVMNKLEYTINNNAQWVGNQGSDGDPEVIQRAIPSIDVDLVVGVKYDANTANLWESWRAGTTETVEISDNATWASATAGLKANDCKITADVQPGQTDAGVFQDISLRATATTSGDVIQIVP